MPGYNIDILSQPALLAAIETKTPVARFFRDRYFSTNDGDLFNSEKVIVEYKNGEDTIAPMISPHVGDILIGTDSYSAREITPGDIRISTLLSIDRLSAKGFGEALFSQLSPQERQARLLIDDMDKLDRAISLREEHMAVQTMINNGYTMQTIDDEGRSGPVYNIAFYDESSDHTYTVSNKWSSSDCNIYGDIVAMCETLAKRGLPAVDLVLGSSAASAFRNNSAIKELLKTYSGTDFGEIKALRSEYPYVALLGILNFDGFLLNVFVVNESYKDVDGTTKAFFPSKSALITAPDCGHTMYGRVTYLDEHGSFITSVGRRIPKAIINEESDLKKLRVYSRPLAAPKNYCPFMYAADVVT